MRLHVLCHPVDLRRTFMLQAMGPYDPTASLSDLWLRKSFATAEGVCTVEVRCADEGLQIEISGACEQEIAAQLATGFAQDTSYHEFVTEHELIAKLHRTQPGLRLLRVPWLWDVACGAILQQRVRFVDAASEWRKIAGRYGQQEAGAVTFPDPARLAAVPLFELERLGIDVKRARTLLLFAREMRSHPITFAMPVAEVRARLNRVPGIGPWTVDTVAGFALGDPDALPTGDLYLPHMVTYALAGEQRGTDERMLELMEPFRGQRWRVARLLYGAKIEIPRASEPRRSSYRR